MKNNKMIDLPNEFVSDIKSIINVSRANAVKSVDRERVKMYWQIGDRIFVEEQNGKERAEYGKQMFKVLARTIEVEFGSGFSIRQLERARQFYRTYPIASALRSQLNWLQYKLLISIADSKKLN